MNRAPRIVATVSALATVVTMASACTDAPKPPPPSAVATTIQSGLELDRSLRAGQQQGKLTLPPFGRLLAATQSGTPATIQVQLDGVTGPVIVVFICEGGDTGPNVKLRRAGKSLVGLRTDGCDASNLYSGQSEPIGEGGPAELVIRTSPGTRFALVVEEVTDR